MSLTGTALPVLLAVLLVAGLAAVLLLWRRVRGPRWARRTQHWGLLVANQVLAVLLVGVLANDAGDFYSSWSDLFGTAKGSSSEYSVGAGTTPSTDALSHVATTPFSTTNQRDRRGQLLTATVDGAASGLTVPVHIYLPPQYFQSSYSNDRFPVVESVDPAGSASGVATTYLRALHDRSARPAVLVLVDATGPAWRSACVSSASGPQTTGFLDADLPLALGAGYRVRSTGWGAMGTGAGGYCAAKLAITEPNLFWAGAPTDAVFTPPGPDTLPAQNDLLLRLQTVSTPPARLLVLDTTTAGTAARQQLAALHPLVRPPMQVTAGNPPSVADAQRQALQWVTGHIPAAGR